MLGYGIPPVRLAVTGEGPSEFEILIYVSRLVQLFHSLDPSPFRERDLDAEAESYIVDWAREAPRNAPISVVVQLPPGEAGLDAQRIVEDAMHNNFDYRASQATRQLRELFREGRQSLLIGVPVLAASLVASQVVAASPSPSTLARVASESLLILGWVANWRPLEIFLYGWWPILHRRSLFQRLASARVVVRPA